MFQTLVGVVIGVCWVVARVSGVRSCCKVSCVPFSNLCNAESHFHVGDPHLACNCRSPTKCVEICIYVMPVSAKECSALSLHELFDFRGEFVR